MAFNKKRKKKDSSKFWRSPRGRASFPWLAKGQVDEDDPDRIVYSVQLNFKKDKKRDDNEDLRDRLPPSLHEMYDVLFEAAAAEFGEEEAYDMVEAVFKDGDTHKTMKKRPENRGMWCLSFRSAQIKPAICYVNEDGDVVDMEKEDQKEELYPGHYGMVSYNTYTFDVGKNAGVSLGLRTYVKVEDGEKLVMHASADKDWGDADMSEYARKPKSSRRGRDDDDEDDAEDDEDDDRPARRSKGSGSAKTSGRSKKASGRRASNSRDDDDDDDDEDDEDDRSSRRNKSRAKSNNRRSVDDDDAEDDDDDEPRRKRKPKPKRRMRDEDEDEDEDDEED